MLLLTPVKIARDRNAPGTFPQRATRDALMEQAQLSDVQLVNLTLLLTIRDSIQHDQITACARFALTRELAERLIAMSVQHVMAIVANVGNTSLFPPRGDLVSLLERPLPLSGPLAAVHTCEAMTA